MTEKIYSIYELKVTGMNCTNCALGIKKTLEKGGFKSVEANFATDEVKFEAEGEEQLQNAVKKIQSLGYQVFVPERGEEAIKANKIFSIEAKFLVSAVFTIPLIMAMFLPYEFMHADWFQLTLTIPVFLIGIWHFGKSAFMSLRSGVANMDVLITLGSTAAFVYSLIGTINQMGHKYMFYETSASIITIVLLGNLLEHRSVKRTTTAVEELTRLQKKTARRLAAGTHAEQEVIEEVDVNALAPGDRVLVNTGDQIPIDGVIVWGHGNIDESMISGESLPVDKGVEDAVVGGTLLLQGTLKVKVTATGKQTVLSQIIEMVKKAQQDKPQLQNLADKISGIFVPTVVILAILTLLGNLWLTDLPFRDALMRGVAVLVIACPCALGLAIPTAVVVGLGKTAKSGILIRGGSTFDKISQVDTMVFDKTGTLTTGKFKIKEIKAFGKSLDGLKSVIYSLEKHSSHPIAQSLVKELKGYGKIDLEKVSEQKGLGLDAYDKNESNYKIGSYSIASHLTHEDQHNLYVLMDNQLIGWVDLEDEIKPEARETISFLKAKGIKTVLLSGDKSHRCHELAQTLGIDIVYAEQLPHQKLEIIEKLGKDHKVAMVGDGINDSPALAKAFLGVSMSNATQVAVKSAEVILLKGNLSLIRKSLKISGLTLVTIRQNLFWAFFYNVMAIPLAMTGYLSPMVAAFAMAFSDLVVVFNSLRLKVKKV